MKNDLEKDDLPKSRFQGYLSRLSIAQNNSPPSRIVFNTWFVHDKLWIKWQGHRLSGLEENSQTAWRPPDKTPMMNNSCLTFSPRVLNGDFERVFLPENNNNKLEGLQNEDQLVYYVIHRRPRGYWCCPREMFTSRKSLVPSVSNCSQIDAFPMGGSVSVGWGRNAEVKRQRMDKHKS